MKKRETRENDEEIKKSQRRVALIGKVANMSFHSFFFLNFRYELVSTIFCKARPSAPHCLLPLTYIDGKQFQRSTRS